MSNPFSGKEKTKQNKLLSWNGLNVLCSQKTKLNFEALLYGSQYQNSLATTLSATLTTRCF